MLGYDLVEKRKVWVYIWVRPIQILEFYFWQQLKQRLCVLSSITSSSNTKYEM